ncbi:ABC transporter permease [Methylomicrobium sp. RS1]|uniref:ABC transporter permease n=1 Tax=Candidatus Methylomicrobium oryzae TaxID=2802053 RepID=UPI001923CE63|nr:ABC transporter permease [Methylomicrobium sp. RS1]MBL1263420.1 ABC transporter permease [Methylomicrobium sp. RS1]
MNVRVPAQVLESLLIPVSALLAALLLFGIFLACLGNDPLAVFHSMVRGGFGSAFAWRNTLERAAPLMLTALCTALPAQLGLIVIGGEGALVVGGVSAALAGGLAFEDQTPWLAIAAMLIAGTAAGGAWIGLVGWLKHYRGINETITSLLFNYIAIALMNHLVTGPWRDPASLNKPSTRPVGSAHMLGDMPGLGVHWGLALALALCLVCYTVFRQTTFGFAVRIAGGNPRAARLAGLPVGLLTLITCFWAGAAAGLAGSIEVAAIQGAANASLAAGYGYAGILAAFLARQNPLAVIPVALILGGISASAGLLQRSHHLPDAAVLMLQGIIFITILSSETCYGRLQPWLDSRRRA